MRDAVVAERSSGGITGLHLQRLLEDTVNTNPTYAAHYEDETLLVRFNSLNVDWTITLPPLSDVHPGRRLYVVDGTEPPQATLIQIYPAGTDLIENLTPPLTITTNWGKRAFQSIEVAGVKRWLTWAL